MAVRKSDLNVGSLFGLRDDKPADSTQSVNSFAFDKMIYDDIYEQSPAIQKSVAKGDEILRTYTDLAQDLYMSLYKHKPELMEKEDMKDTHQFNHQLMEQIMDTDEFRKLRRQTRLDILGSAMGMEAMNEQMIAMIQEYQEQMQQQTGQDPFEGINDQMDQEGQGDSDGQQGGGGMSEEEAKEQAKNRGNQPVPQPQMDPNMMDQLKQKMQQAMSKATDDVSETRDFLQAWGMEQGDPANRISYEDKKAALQRLRHSPKLKKLSELVGRMKKLAINEKTEVSPDGAEAIKSVKTGNDITAILPSEQALLASSNKIIKRNFYRRFHDNELLEYDKDVFESKGKGPLIVCVDTSGSMSGEREQWAKAVALALLEVATKHKRDFACIHYDSRISGEWVIPHGQLRPDDVFDIAERFSSGGTNFWPPLERSIEIIRQNPKYAKSDVVFITDGDCYMDERQYEEIRQAKKDDNFQIFSVLIDMAGGGATSGVRHFSDKIIEVSNLADLKNNGTLDIFRSVKQDNQQQQA